jgi:hypothetical protein
MKPVRTMRRGAAELEEVSTNLVYRRKTGCVKGRVSELASQRVSKLAKQPRSDASAHFEGQKRIFPVIFRGQISPCGRFLAVRLSNGIDFKRVKNNLQGLWENLYPSGV